MGALFRAAPLWRQTPSDRILGDELFLRVTHTVEARAFPLRDAVDEGQYRICKHLCTSPTGRSLQRQLSGIDPMPELEKPDGSPLWRASWAVPRLCHECLTDYTITVETAEVREVYQSGDGRAAVSGSTVVLSCARVR